MDFGLENFSVSVKIVFNIFINEQGCAVMKTVKGISFIELLFILAIAIVLIVLLSGQLLKDRQENLNRECVVRLGRIGKALNKYNKAFYNGKAPDIVKLTPEQEMSPEATLLPLIALVRAGLIKSAEEVTCPVGHGEKVAVFSNAPNAPKNLLYYASKKDLKFSDIVLRNRKGEVMSSYLFTYKYGSLSHKNRVIAAEAAVADGSVSLGYSINHGDHVENGKFVYVGGANALFSDGHVKSCDKDYMVNGAADPNNLWLSGTAGVSPSFKRLDSDIITRDTSTAKLTVIGGITPVSE